MPKKVFYVMFGIGAVLNIVCWLILYLAIPAANFPFIIKYTVGSPSDFWGTRSDLFLVPLLGLIILFVDAIVSYSISAKNNKVALMVAAVAVYGEFLVVLYTLATVYVNTY